MLQTILILLGILFLHWIGDGVLQTDKMARGKSSNWEDLLNHTLVYSGVYIIPTVIYIGVTGNMLMLLFPSITFLFHTATDYYTSRINKRLWEAKKIHEFFVMVLFDQFLHFTQLFLTFYYLNETNK